MQLYRKYKQYTNKWEITLQSKFDIQLDIIQKNIIDNCNNIRSEIKSLYNSLKTSNLNEACSSAIPQQTSDEFTMGPEYTREATTLRSNLSANTHNNNNNNQFFPNFYTNNNLYTNLLSQKNNDLNNNNKLCSIPSNQNTIKSSFFINDILNIAPSISNKNLRSNFFHNELTNNNNSTNSNLNSLFTVNTDTCNGSISSRGGDNRNSNSSNIDLNLNTDVHNFSQSLVPTTFTGITPTHTQPFIPSYNNSIENSLRLQPLITDNLSSKKQNYNSNYNYNTNNNFYRNNNYNNNISNNDNSSTPHIIPPPLPHIPYNNISESRIEDQEIYISGFMKLSSDHDLEIISLAIIRGIIPSFNRSDILSVRLVYTRGNNSSQASKFPSIIPRLKSSILVKKILLLQRSKNYFSTNDIDHSLLSEINFSGVPPTKIILNSVLSPQEYKHYSALKDIARNLGFKYIWHREGKFLVKRRTGDRLHYFTSAVELRAIWACYSDKDDNTATEIEIGGLATKNDNKNTDSDRI